MKLLDLKSKLKPIKLTTLFVSILLLLIIFPFIPQESGHGMILDIAVSLILIVSIYALSNNRKYFKIALALGIPSFLLTITLYFFDNPALMFCNCLFKLLFFLYIITIALLYILGQSKINQDLLFGALSVYFLIGLSWMHFYSMLEIVIPGSFYGVYDSAGYSYSFLGNFLYFSFVTLTTLGYGDLVPMTLPAKVFSVLEAVTGQFYLAVLIARLIGLHLVNQTLKRS